MRKVYARVAKYLVKICFDKRTYALRLQKVIVKRTTSRSVGQLVGWDGRQGEGYDAYSAVRA